MNTLGKPAAVATIIAAAFTVAAYFNQSQHIVIEKVVDVQRLNHNPTAMLEAEVTPVPNAKLRNTKTTSKEAGVSLNNNESSLISRHKVALKIPGSITQNGVLERLAKEATNLGYYDTAYTIALDIKGSITQNSTLSYVSIAIAKSGNIEFAAEVASSIQGSITKSSTLEQIINM